MIRLFKEQGREDSLYLMLVSIQHVIYDSSSAAYKSRPVKHHQPDVALDSIFVFSTKIMADYGTFHTSVKLFTKQKVCGIVVWPKTSLNCHHFYGRPGF